MRPDIIPRPLPPCLAVAVALALVAALAVPGRACEKHTSSATASNAAARGTCAASVSCVSSPSCTASASCPAGACSAVRATTASATRTSAASRKALAKKLSVKQASTKRALGSTPAALASRTPGLVVVIDPLTGGVAEATPSQLQDFAATLKTGNAIRSAVPGDPEVVRLPDGTLMCDVPERLMMNAIAHRDASGKITFDCARLPAGPAATTRAQTSPQTLEVK